MQRELSDTMRDFSTTTTTMISFSKLENNVDNARLTPELKWQKAQIFTVCTSITLNGTESTRYVLGVLVRCGQYIESIMPNEVPEPTGICLKIGENIRPPSRTYSKLCALLVPPKPESNRQTAVGCF